MGKSKSDDGPASQPEDVEKLSRRVEEMATKLTANLETFKRELLKKVKAKTSESDISQRFNDFEKLVVSNIKDIKTEIDQLKTDISKPAATTADNNNILLLHGVEEDRNTQHFDTLEEVIKIISNGTKQQLTKNEINFCYRLGKFKANAQKPRPIVVCFCRRWFRDQIFYNKKNLKGTKYLLTEMLVPEKLALYKEARKRFKNSCWTVYGKVYVFSDGSKVYINSLDKLNELSQPVSDTDDNEIRNDN